MLFAKSPIKQTIAYYFVIYLKNVIVKIRKCIKYTNFDHTLKISVNVGF